MKQPSIAILCVSVAIVWLSFHQPHSARSLFPVLVAAGLVYMSNVSLKRLMKRTLPLLAIALIPVVLIPIFIRHGNGVIDLYGFEITNEGLNRAATAMYRVSFSLFMLSAIYLRFGAEGLVRGAANLKIPPVVLMILSSAIRYIEVFMEEARRMQIAVSLRGYHGKIQTKPLQTYAGIIGGMFVSATVRARQIHSAAIMRQYSGIVPYKKEPLSSSDIAAIVLTFGLLIVDFALYVLMHTK